MYMHEFHLLNKHFLGSVINQKAFFMSTGKVPSDVVRQCSQPESLCIHMYVCVCVNDMAGKFSARKLGLGNAAAVPPAALSAANETKSNKTDGAASAF